MVPKDFSALALSADVCVPRKKPAEREQPGLSLAAGPGRGGGTFLPSSLTWGVSGTGMAITH